MSNSLQLWTVAHQAPWFMEFSRQEYWNGLPFPSPGDLPDLGIEPRSPALQAGSLPSEPPNLLIIWAVADTWSSLMPLGHWRRRGERWLLLLRAQCHDNSCLSHLWHFHVDRALSQVLLYPNCLFRFLWNICDLLLPICCSLTKNPAWNWNKH